MVFLLLAPRGYLIVFHMMTVDLVLCRFGEDLSYGQTSSGKSYSMGTAMDVGQSTSFDITPNTGLIPRAVADIFKRCAESERQAGGRQNFKYEAVCSFVELYNEVSPS